jgi:hypothetical protein
MSESFLPALLKSAPELRTMLDKPGTAPEDIISLFSMGEHYLRVGWSGCGTE